MHRISLCVLTEVRLETKRSWPHHSLNRPSQSGAAPAAFRIHGKGLSVIKKTVAPPNPPRRTIEPLDRCDAPVDQGLSVQYFAALRQLALIAGLGGQVLEMGSGLGRDADLLETFGIKVRRTRAVCPCPDLHAASAEVGEPLNIITDDFGGPYDAVVARHALSDVPRDSIDSVLEKVAKALRPRGAFLVSVCQSVETDEKCRLVCWHRNDFAARLKTNGLTVLWDEPSIGSGNQRWNLFLARRTA